MGLEGARRFLNGRGGSSPENCETEYDLYQGVALESMPSPIVTKP
jgi:hypothetical protein